MTVHSTIIIDPPPSVIRDGYKYLSTQRYELEESYKEYQSQLNALFSPFEVSSISKWKWTNSGLISA